MYVLPLSTICLTLVRQGQETPFRFSPAGYMDDDGRPHVYWPPFDARLMLSHRDRRVLAEDIDLMQHRTGFSCMQQNPNYRELVRCRDLTRSEVSR